MNEYASYFKSLYDYADRCKWVTVFAVGFALSIAARVVFQPLPSVDPLLPIVFLAAMRMGWRESAALGSSAYYASNFFVVGGQGFWTIPMVAGAALVGICGSVFRQHAILGILLGTVLYELVVNVSLAFMFDPLLALPFALTHIVSNAVFVAVGVKLLERWK